MTKIAEKTKMRIIKAAKVAFSENGYTKTTIKDISSSADVGVGSIYLYFKNKEDLYRTLIKKEINYFNEYTNTFKENPPLEALQAIFGYYMDYSVKNMRLLPFNMGEHIYNTGKVFNYDFYCQQKNLFSYILGRGVTLNIFKKLDPVKTADLFICTLRGLIIGYIRKDIADLRIFRDIFLDSIVCGIRSVN